MRQLFVALCILCFTGFATAPAMAGRGGVDTAGGQSSHRLDDESSEEVCLCHLPPGNPDNPQTLCVGEHAAMDHLRHGDSMGECFAAAGESICNDGMDDDQNGMADCQDPECLGQVGAGGEICQQPEVSCDDGMDNDGDASPDCADSDCSSLPACDTPEPEICNDGLDNDADNQIDCADPDCMSASACNTSSTEVCNDGVDNDGDGSTDCGDPDCAVTPACDSFFEICDDGIDNDLDATIDCADTNCADHPACSPPA